MARFKKQLDIYVPLSVMLLITLLAGSISFQLSKNWQEGLRETADLVTRSVILNNVRWHLRETQALLPQQPDRALQKWEEARAQLWVINHANPRPSATQQLTLFMSNPENIAAIENVLESPQFFPNDADFLSQRLQKLEAHAMSIGFTTCGILMLLGFILMCLTAKHLKQLLTALEQSRDTHILVQEDERRRIAQDLHDEVIQQLIDLKRKYAPEKVDTLIEMMRRICHNLKPQILEDVGFGSALDFLSDQLRHQAQCQVQLELDEKEVAQVPQTYQLPIYRVIQELLTNIKKHAQASQVYLSLVSDLQESRRIRIFLSDNGRGFDPSTSNLNMGLRGVRERIALLGGTFSLDSKANGKGTRIQITVPVEDPLL